MMMRSIALGAAMLFSAAASPAWADSVSMFCGASEYELCAKAAAGFKEKTGNEVKITKMPALLDDAIPIYQQLLAAQSTDADVLFIDVIWIGMLQRNMLDLKPLVPAEEVSQHFQSTIDAATTQDGRLVALPWYMDTGLMYYRKDLLEKYGKQPPKTWDELTETAKFIQDKERAAGSPDLWGFTWQGKSYEGLTCDAIEWIASGGGGTIIEPDGKVTINNPEAAKALTRAKGWVKTISPEGVLGYDEETSRAVFEAGNAVFHRNWPYVWGTSQADGSKVAGKVGMMALPVGADGQKSSGCLGPMYLGISKYTAKPELATELLRYLVGPEVQKMRAIEGAYNPTQKSLYSDKEVLAKLPFLADAQAAFDGSVARPSGYTGSSYNRVSQAFYRAVHEILADGADVDKTLADLAGRLERLKESR
ncbi:ABC transporter substrate-binding protein [Mesorhizobium sp. IRAMC:0171]|uniref:ABC transporter substrate-binding protein n=2 Tax=Mesorhizobium retamae TaxID=2912854 RepID=A0ABS9QM96_9HYPH|nr:ABC transporter substrate-binding protein [Mesorhizobium sp. IRAMC:0171]MCG7508576.1 ABC transporter substrate-binding protein [Mesorhizobium sp. IRAMC:0171]